jgi:hypothetical protein
LRAFADIMYLIETLFRGDAIELKYEDRGERVVLIAKLAFATSEGALLPTLFEPETLLD